jgi:DHA1 family tetracycline resistance protein-like MFS transporter
VTTDRRLAIILAIVFVDLLGFSLILPLVPFYAERFGASNTVTGLLVASYAAAQFLGAPFLGRLSDRFGRRPVLIVSILGTAVGFVMLGLARSLAMLFASRILDGLTGGNVSVAQAYISDITDRDSRARAFGFVGAAFGLGFIIGPVVGGLLYGVADSRFPASEAGVVWPFALPAFVAAGMATANLVATYRFLPETLSAERRKALAESARAEYSLRNLGSALRRPDVGPLLIARLAFGFAFSLFTLVFTLWAKERLGLDARAASFVFTYVGILIVVVQGGLITPLTARYDERLLMLAATILLSAGLLAWAATPSLPALLVVLIPIAFAGGVFNTVINSVLSKSVLPMEVGGILGLSASLESLTRVLGPTVGGALLDALGPWAPGVFGAAVTAVLAVYERRTGAAAGSGRALFAGGSAAAPGRNEASQVDTADGA